MAVIEQGIATKNKKSSRYFEGRYIVPYDKGGESDAEGGWMPNYYVPTNYFLDWSEWSVTRMKTFTIAERIREYGEDKVIKPHYEQTACAVFRSVETYFRAGLTFSRTGVYSPTFRLNSGAVYDTEGSTIFLPVEEEKSMILLTSKLTKFLLKNYAGHTVHCQVDELKELPFLIKLPVSKLIASIIKKQKANPRYDYASHEQLEIDQLVYAAYGLNAADVAEVEAWYARRYPRLAAAQAANCAPVAVTS